MKIASLYIDNFLGARRVELDTRAPVQLFAGRNGAGKSSVRDAVALALTADLGRVSLKKEAPQLINEGAETACVEVKTADGDTYTVTINAAGKITDSMKGKEADPVLTYVLDGQRFARLSDKERQAFLFGVMGVKTSTSAVKERLTARGFDTARIERIAPMLRAGFEAASKDAKSKATEAKGGWRQITGENYGSEKAKTWRAPVPTYDAEQFKQLTTELQHADVALASWNQKIGQLQGEEQRRADLRAKLVVLEEQTGRLDRLEVKLKADEEQQAALDAELQRVRQAAGAAPRVGMLHDLAKSLDNCLRMVIPFGDLDNHQKESLREANASMDAYEREHGKVCQDAGDPEALARIPELTAALALMSSAVANATRDVAAAKRAQDEIAAINAELAETFDAAGLGDAKAQAQDLTEQRAAIVKRLDGLKTAKAQADAAAQKTEEASKLAEEVAAWDAIGDALGPSGIPGELLKAALTPLNKRLAQSGTDAEWPAVTVHDDMRITCGLRDYALLSESEKWRADAMLAEAISHLSGCGLLVLDRFDVLDLKGREDLIAWLDVLAQNGEISTALIFGTLKVLPSTLPATMAAHWLDQGTLNQLKAAA